MPSTTSVILLTNFLRGSLQEVSTDIMPKCQPKYLPELWMMKSLKAGTLTLSQLLIERMVSSSSLTQVIINTHLQGFKCKPATRAANLKMEAWVRNDESMRRAEPKSSAHTLVRENPGLSESFSNKKRKGFMHKRNKIELRGHPVSTPPLRPKTKRNHFRSQTNTQRYENTKL